MKAYKRGTLVKGHQIASGKNKNSPYPAGSIALQTPVFRKLGLEVGQYHSGTLNLSVEPNTFKILHPDHHFKKVNWFEGLQPETFSFIGCELKFNSVIYSALIYYPHPETKTQHFQPQNIIEILCPTIPNIIYGDPLELIYNPKKLEINR